MEAHFNRPTIFLLYFYDTYDVNLREKNFGRSTAYSCRTNVFIKFNHLMKRKGHTVEYSHISKISVTLLGETSQFPTSGTSDGTITNN